LLREATPARFPFSPGNQGNQGELPIPKVGRTPIRPEGESGMPSDAAVVRRGTQEYAQGMGLADEQPTDVSITARMRPTIP